MHVNVIDGWLERMGQTARIESITVWAWRSTPVQLSTPASHGINIVMCVLLHDITLLPS